MINKIKDSISRSKQWSKDHHSAWEPMIKINDVGTTQFQKLFIQKLEENDLIESVELQGTKERYFLGFIKGTINQFCVYINGAELSGPDIDLRLEEWDFKTPDELIDEFVEKANKLRI